MSPSVPIEAIRLRGRLRKRPPAARQACILLGVAALILTAVLLVLPRPAAAQAVRGEASLITTGGYARIVLKFPEPIDAQVRMSSGVLIVSFARPIAVAVDKINNGATDWIGAARRDPDGRALRFAVARKVKLNTIVAAERLYIDLLPDTWTADLPGLPQDVVEDLARRTRDAELAARRRNKVAEQRQAPPVRVRVASHVTFTRYMFSLPELTAVSADRGKDKLTLKFAAPLTFDLADAKLASPPGLESIQSTLDTDASMSEVRFAFSDMVDVRTFREDFNYVVDVTPIIKPTRPAVAAAPPPAVAEPPAVVVPKPQTAEPPPASQQPATQQPEAAASDPAATKPVQQPVEPPPSVEPAASPAPAAPQRDPNRPVAAELHRQGDNLRVLFPFAVPTPSAIFQRADTVWLVFDTLAKLDVAALQNEPSRTIRDATLTRADTAQVLRLRLERPRLTSAVMEGTGWSVVIGESVVEPTKPLAVIRNIIGPARTSITVPFDDPRQLHRIDDADIGDTLLVVTGLGPSRGFVKTREFVELRTLASTHGVVIQPLADDLNVELSADKIVLGRPSGLTLSESGQSDRRMGIARAVTFDSQLWGFDRKADFNDRQFELIGAAADAPPAKRAGHRLDLARFYLSREMFAEAKAVLDVAIADDRSTSENPNALVLRAIANIMLNRIEPALKDLTSPRVGNQNDAQLWRALAYARLGKWGEARDGFRHVDGAIAALPLELQRLALTESLRAAIEVGDLATATNRLNDFETVGVPPDLEPLVSLLTGRLAEALGRSKDALASYRYAVESRNQPAAAEGKLREIVLRNALGDIKKPDVIKELETLTTLWRGDDTEVEAQHLLARLYTEDARYREAFQIMRIAFRSHPHSEIARRMQEEAAATFGALFLDGKADPMPPIDSLSLFYDYRDLTPIGRRGDEMIRRLAERLVSVDLLDQAGELLQHQVDNRLQGAARAQVATRLAVVYLLSRKPERAQATLRATRTADLSNELRNQRLLLEARALSDIGRHDLALEVIGNIDGREAIRLRSDINWAARRWQQAAEQIELFYGDRWRTFEPLADTERSDILRAGIGFALGGDSIGIGRLKEKYSAKFADGADRRAFDVVTGGLGTNSAEVRDVARLIAAVDTLEGFLREMRARYPDMGVPPQAAPSQPAPAKPDRAAALPQPPSAVAAQ